jgi:hypothetical protein
MQTFVALYRGDTIAEARLVAVSADPALVADIANQMLHETSPTHDDDLVMASVEHGRKRALRQVLREVER